MKQNFILQSSKNNPIRISYYSTEGALKDSCLVLVHGFKGFKDWGFFPYAAEYFSNHGFNTIAFNFSHNGVGEDLENFIELDKFANNTYSLEVDELNDVIEACRNTFFGTSYHHIGLIGHSRGGLSAIINARNNNAVEGLATWAGVSQADRFTVRQKREWKDKGYFEIMNVRTNQLMRLNKTFLDDLEMNSENKFNLKNILPGLNIPYLVVQGEQDLAVKITEAENLYEWSNSKNKELYLIPATGHTFDVVHPFTGSTKKFNLVLEKTFKFFSEIFK